MTSPAAAAFTADWMEPYGAVDVPVPVPVGETYISFALALEASAASAAVTPNDRIIIRDWWWKEID